MKIYYLLFLSLLSLCLHAQDVFKDSLNEMNGEELLAIFKKAETDSIKAKKNNANLFRPCQKRKRYYKNG